MGQRGYSPQFQNRAVDGLFSTSHTRQTKFRSKSPADMDDAWNEHMDGQSKHLWRNDVSLMRYLFSLSEVWKRMEQALKNLRFILDLKCDYGFFHFAID